MLLAHSKTLLLHLSLLASHRYRYEYSIPPFALACVCTCGYHITLPQQSFASFTFICSCVIMLTVFCCGRGEGSLISTFGGEIDSGRLRVGMGWMGWEGLEHRLEDSDLAIRLFVFTLR